MRTGTDYVKPTPEQMAKIATVVEQILSDPEVRRGYMSVLRSGMMGQTLEKFTMANGSGRNGKTFLHELFMAAMGEYAIKGNIAIITDKMKSGPNPELANLDKKRFVLWAEPEENQSRRLSPHPGEVAAHHRHGWGGHSARRSHGRHSGGSW